MIEEDVGEQNARNMQTEQMDIMLREMGLPPNMFDPETRTNRLNMLFQVSSKGDVTKQVIHDFSGKYTSPCTENVFYTLTYFRIFFRILF